MSENEQIRKADKRLSLFGLFIMIYLTACTNIGFVFQGVAIASFILVNIGFGMMIVFIAIGGVYNAFRPPKLKAYRKY